MENLNEKLEIVKTSTVGNEGEGEGRASLVSLIPRYPPSLRWLNTVLRAVSGNSRTGACFNLDQKKLGNEKAMVHRRRFVKIYSLKFCDIWHIFPFIVF